MLLPKFDFHDPATVAEACQIMAEFGDKAKPVAGGTDLMVNMKKKVMCPDHVVSLSRIDALKNADSSNGLLKIGACFTVAELAASENIRKQWSALANGATALPWSEILPPSAATSVPVRPRSSAVCGSYLIPIPKCRVSEIMSG